jgi:hypothetical protein
MPPVLSSEIEEKDRGAWGPPDPPDGKYKGDSPAAGRAMGVVSSIGPLLGRAEHSFRLV